MSDDFLDEIEKVIDDFSLEGKNEINNKVKQPSFGGWDSYYRHEYEIGYMPEEIEHRGTRLGPNHFIQEIICGCKANIVMVIKRKEPQRFDEWVHRPMEKIHQFQCPFCCALWRTVGRVEELKIKR